MANRIQEFVAEQWFNKPQGGTPITAERLNKIEQQVETVTTAVNGLEIPDPGELGGVKSVNGETGDVTLDATDVGAIPSSVEIKQIVRVTQAAYDALATKVATTLYVIVG